MRFVEQNHATMRESVASGRRSAGLERKKRLLPAGDGLAIASSACHRDTNHVKQE